MLALADHTVTVAGLAVAVGAAVVALASAGFAWAGVKQAERADAFPALLDLLRD